MVAVVGVVAVAGVVGVAAWPQAAIKDSTIKILTVTNWHILTISFPSFCLMDVTLAVSVFLIPSPPFLPNQLHRLLLTYILQDYRKLALPFSRLPRGSGYGRSKGSYLNCQVVSKDLQHLVSPGRASSQQKHKAHDQHSSVGFSFAFVAPPFIG